VLAKATADATARAAGLRNVVAHGYAGVDVAMVFDEAWALIAATFEVEVTVLANVIAFTPLPAPKKPRVKVSR
jgi:hypothetical protein